MYRSRPAYLILEDDSSIILHDIEHGSGVRFISHEAALRNFKRLVRRFKFDVVHVAQALFATDWS